MMEKVLMACGAVLGVLVLVDVAYKEPLVIIAVALLAVTLLGSAGIAGCLWVWDHLRGARHRAH